MENLYFEFELDIFQPSFPLPQNKSEILMENLVFEFELDMWPLLPQWKGELFMENLDLGLELNICPPSKSGKREKLEKVVVGSRAETKL